MTFKFQQPDLDIESARKPGKAAVTADDAVTGYDDGEGVSAYRTADGRQLPSRTHRTGDV